MADWFKVERKYYDELVPHDDATPYNTSLASVASTALVQSDRFAHLMDNTPDALYGRYEFRDGAACVLAEVFGLDLDYAREIMRTGQAWVDYCNSKEEK